MDEKIGSVMSVVGDLAGLGSAAVGGDKKDFGTSLIDLISEIPGVSQGTILGAKLEWAFITDTFKLTSDFFDNGFDLAERLANGEDVDFSVSALLGIQDMPFTKLFSKSSLCGVMDPSGYVYEAIQTNRVGGAQATAYCVLYDGSGEDFWEKPDEEKAALWNAEDFSQVNPQMTDDAGNFIWMVPSGWWKIQVEKEGYELAESEWMAIPPERTNVEIPIRTTVSPEIISIAGHENGTVTMCFSQYMKTDSVSEQSLRAIAVRDSGQKEEINVTVTAENPETTGSRDGIATEFTIIPSENAKTIVFCLSGAENYAGKELDTAEWTCTFPLLQESSCACGCHKTGIMNFYFRILRAIGRLFHVETLHYCECGVLHW